MRLSGQFRVYGKTRLPHSLAPLTLKCKPNPSQTQNKEFYSIAKADGVMSVQRIMYYLEIMLAKLKDKIIRSYSKLYVPAFDRSNLNRAIVLCQPFPSHL